MKYLTASLIAMALTATTAQGADKFNYVVDRFADIEILRYKVPGFEDLTLNQKTLIYYLTEAALQGRDILWDQNGKYNLEIRKLMEGVYTNYKGDKNNPQYKALEKYLKQIWMGNGIHHHYSQDKFIPEFTPAWLIEQLGYTPSNELLGVIFDPNIMPKRVNQAEGQDLILTSANNLYEGVTQREVEDYYNALKNPNDSTPSRTASMPRW